MLNQAKDYLNQILELLKEIDSYNFYKSQIKDSLDKIFQLYQAGRIDSIKYDGLKQKILKGKTKKQLLAYYNNYIVLLLKQIHNNNTLMFDLVYHSDLEKLSKALPIKVKALLVEERKELERKELPALEKIEEEIMPLVKVPEKEEVVVPEPKFEVKPEPVPLPEELPKPTIEPEVLEKPAKISLKEKVGSYLENVKEWVGLVEEKHKGAKIAKEIEAEEAKRLKAEIKIENPFKWFFNVIKELFVKKKETKEAIEPIKIKVEEFEVSKKEEPEPVIEKKGIVARTIDKIKIDLGLIKKAEETIIPKKLKAEAYEITFAEGVNKFSVRALIQDWLDRILRKKEEQILEGTFISPSLIKLADVSYQDFQKMKEESPIDAGSILKEAEKIKKRLSQQKSTPVYKPLLLGSIANVTVRPITNWVISRFPNFFKTLYIQLRFANIQILSNTYVNIMIFATSNIAIITFFIYTILSILRFQPLLFAIFSGIGVGIACGFATFFGFYYYPNTLISQRRKSIKTNLPFGINHIAAIAASGIPPVMMFKLVADSREYGEFCIELQKIVDYIELFGYDLVTAVRAASTITPEENLKEFFEGVINTIESGGDLERYLMQKSEESLSFYEIERKKYTETVATYSDIYTGVLIAAPLFFVAALTLVSMLGGTIGKYSISTIIGLATYIVIPVMNIGFIIFLNISQPEV